MTQRARVTLSQTVDCPTCDEPIDVLFVLPEGVWEPQDIEEPPSTEYTCPACGAVETTTYEGWSNYDDA